MQLHAKECQDCWQEADYNGGAQKGWPSPQGISPTHHEMPTAQSRTGGIQASTAATDSEGQLGSHLDLGHQVSETLAAHMPIDSGILSQKT